MSLSNLNKKINIEYIVLIVSLFTFMLFLDVIWTFTIDDAYISFRYAKHLVEGYGLVWNVGEPPTEGYTNFLWVLIVAGLMYLNIDPIIGTKIVGLISLLAIIYFYRLYISNIFIDKKAVNIGFAISVALILANPATAIHTVSGLETMLYSALLILVTYLTYIQLTSNSISKYTYIVLLTTSLLRPEGILVSIAVVLTLSANKFFNGYKSIGVLIFRDYVIYYLLPMIVYSILRNILFWRSVSVAILC